MSFLDKVKAGVKTGAEQAATKAQAEFERLQRSASSSRPTGSSARRRSSSPTAASLRTTS